MRREVAAEIMTLLEECNQNLNRATTVISKLDSEEEQRRFRKPIGDFFAKSYTEIVIPIIREFPELDPENNGPSSS